MSSHAADGPATAVCGSTGTGTPSTVDTESPDKRDERARGRDKAAKLRDIQADMRDGVPGEPMSEQERTTQKGARQDRGRAADDRGEAASDRKAAKADRDAA